MKVCSKCQISKPLSDFRNKSKSPDGKQAWCRICFAEYERVRYQNGDNLRKKRNDNNRIERNREFIKNYLETHPCVDCGDSDWWALDFDHRVLGTKTKHMSGLIFENGLDRIQAEIALCDVRCQKCHRKRTIEQFGWWRGRDENYLPLGK